MMLMQDGIRSPACADAIFLRVALHAVIVLLRRIKEKIPGAGSSERLRPAAKKEPLLLIG